MPTEKKIISLPFVQGIDSASDPYNVQQGKLLTLKNATIDETGKAKKRFGFAELSQSITGGGTISSARSLLARDSELVLQTDGDLYAYNEGASTWNHIDSLPSAGIQVRASKSPHPSKHDIHAKGICYDETNNRRLIVWTTPADSTDDAGWYIVDDYQTVVASGSLTRGIEDCNAFIADGYFVLVFTYTAATSIESAFINRTTYAVATATVRTYENLQGPFGGCGADELAIAATYGSVDYHEEITTASKNLKACHIGLTRWIAAGTGDAVYYSTDGFATAATLDATGSGNDWYSCVETANYPMVVAGETGASAPVVYRKPTVGAWAVTSAAPSGKLTDMLYTDDATIIGVGSYAGVERSTDEGDTWSQTSWASAPVTGLAYDETNDVIVTALVTPTVYYSDDDGVTWNAITATWDSTTPTLRAVTFCPEQERFIFVGYDAVSTKEYSWYATSDEITGGGTIAFTAVPLPTAWWSVSTVAAHGNTVFARQGLGLQDNWWAKSTDGGETYTGELSPENTIMSCEDMVFTEDGLLMVGDDSSSNMEIEGFRKTLFTYKSPLDTPSWTLADSEFIEGTITDVCATTSSDDGYFIVSYNVDATVYAKPYEGDATTDGATATVGSLYSSIYRTDTTLTGCKIGTTTPEIVLFMEKEPSGAYRSGEIAVGSSTISKSGTYSATSIVEVARQSEIASRSACNIDGLAYVLVRCDTVAYDEQLGVLMVSNTGGVIAKIAGEETFDGTGSIAADGDNKAYIVSTDSVDTTTNALREIAVDLDASDKPITIGSHSYFPGGHLSVYDGRYVTEHGFFRRPFKPVITAGTGSYSYNYVVVFEWADASGWKYYSAPSTPMNHLEATPISSGNIHTFSIPSCTMTNKEGVLITVFRTTDGGSTYYYVGHKVSGIHSYQYFYDSFTDTEISSNRRLYTDGGVLENESLGAVRNLAVYKDRMIAVDAIRPGRVYYSQPGQTFAPYEFCRDTLYWDVEQGDAEITACAEMDDRLLLFKEHGVLFVYGDGPDSTGANGQFSLPARLPGTAGALNDRCIYSFGFGIIFETNRGLFMLDRGMSLKFVGAEVEGDMSGVTSISNIGTSNILAITDGNKCFTFDMLRQQFGTFEPVVAVDSCLHRGIWHWVDSSGKVRRQSTSSYLDGATRVSFEVETGWLKLADLLTVHRASKIQILGDAGAAVTANLDVDTSFSTSSTQTVSFDITAAESPFFRQVTLARQRTSAIKVKIYDGNYTPGTEGSFSVSGLGLEIRPRNTVYKLPSGGRG